MVYLSNKKASANGMLFCNQLNLVRKLFLISKDQGIIKRIE